VPYGLVAAALLATMALESSIAVVVAVRWFVVGGLVLLVGGPARFLAVSTAVVLALATFVLPSPALLRDRSFFGVTEVVPTADGSWTQLMNGTTVHKTQSTDPARSRQATFYYAASGPLGDVFETLAAGPPEASIGVIGLGAGVVATYEQPGQLMTFFEIDPLVVAVAFDRRYFTFFADAPRAPRIVLRDARLSLRDEPAGAFDLQILDVFSSDAVPAHLLTVEALAEDLRVLRPDGLLAIHVSNRYYDLAPAVGAAGERQGLTVVERRYHPTPAEAAAGASPSTWVVATASPAAAQDFLDIGWTATRHEGVEPVTDDHPDVLRFLDLGQ
jgi:spermidine synthase